MFDNILRPICYPTINVPAIAGVYVIVVDKPIYIGQSTDIRKRLTQHRAQGIIPALAFSVDGGNGVALLIFNQDTCETATALSKKTARMVVEGALIMHYRPTLNKRHNYQSLSATDHSIQVRTLNQIPTLCIYTDIGRALRDAVDEKLY